MVSEYWEAVSEYWVVVGVHFQCRYSARVLNFVMKVTFGD